MTDLEQAAQEIDTDTARILRSVLCGPCNQTMAILYATSVGEVWRVIDKRGHYVTDEIGERAAPIRCPKHGDSELVQRRGPP